MSIKVGVIGAGGRMGVEVCKAVDADPGLELAAAVDPGFVGKVVVRDPDMQDDAFVYSESLQALVDSQCSVSIDFTHLDISKGNAKFCAENAIHAVIGTSGFTESDVAELEEQFTNSNCLVAPNFGITAVLLKHLSAIAAPFFETAEIIELHHDGKKDAPSGTAMDLAAAMAKASSDWAPDPTEVQNIPGSRGAKGAGDIPIHAVRMRGMTAHQEVILGTAGQTMTLRQDSYDRASFMPGVILAAKKIADYPGISVGLENYMEI